MDRAEPGCAPADPEAAIQAVRALAPTLRARAEEIDRGGRLPDDLARDLARAGLFRLWTPAAIGGLELSPSDGLRVLEAAAEADAAAGWLGMIASTSGIGGAFLPHDVATRVFGQADGITCGVFASTGEAVEEEGGYRVTGRWAWASGSRNADWIGAGVVVVPRDPAARRTRRSVLFRPDQLHFIDNWQVVGLSGSGSGDIAAEGVFVPRECVYSPVPAERVERGVLYDIPYLAMLALAVGAVHLGNLDGLFGEVRALARVKVPAMSRAPLIERPHVIEVLARAEADLLAGRAFLHHAADTLWHRARAGQPIGVAERALARMASSHAAALAAANLPRLHELAGGTAVFVDSPVQRRLRDGFTMTQHAMTASGTWDQIGRARAGLPGEYAML
ncbi:acyl-CoA dehydrogenase family protein [Zavarzinia sp. CC-PAN008]|uniref:acyl-CoA dehydrogenase family protein n=1 Tax=Zavarzinia sp. CC-PAN008 TaxID=3243332 RepID=UPI003F744E27